MIRLRSAGVVVLLMASSALAFSTGAAPAEDAQEAALRWAFAHAQTDLEDPAVFCIALSPGPLADGVDPDAQFLARFRDHSVPVSPVSHCRFTGHGRRNVLERSSGLHGLLFTISPVEWVTPMHARIGVGFLQGGTWGRGWECDVHRSNAGIWQVHACKIVLHV